MCSPGPLLGPMLLVRGRSWDHCWRSWAALGPLRVVLARAWGHCVRSWAALGAYVGGLGPLLGLCWRSWAALETYVGGLGPKNAKNMATMKMCLFLERERDLRPGGRS